MQNSLISIDGVLYEMVGAKLVKAAEVKQCGRGWAGTKPPGCTRAEKKSGAKAKNTEKKPLKPKSEATPKSVKPVSENKAATSTKEKKPLRSKAKVTAKVQQNPDDGEMLKPYKGTIAAESKEIDPAIAEIIESGQEPWDPALVVGGDQSRAIGGKSNRIIATLNASKNENARAWTIQVPNNAADIKSAQSLQVEDKQPFVSARGEIDSFSDVGQYLKLYTDEISADTGRHKGTARQLTQAAKDLKSASRNWVPVLVRQKGRGEYEVVGNHFAFEAARKAGLERVWTILVDIEGKPLKPKPPGEKSSAPLEPVEQIEKPQPDSSIVRMEPKQEAQSAEDRYASSDPSDEDAANFAREYLQRERKSAHYEGTVEAILSLKDTNPSQTTAAQYAKMRRQAEKEANTLSDDQIAKKYGKNANTNYKTTWEYSLKSDKERLVSAQAERERVVQSSRISEASKAARLKKIDKEIAAANDGIQFFTAKLSGIDDGSGKVKATLNSKREMALGSLGKDNYSDLFAVASHIGALDMTGYYFKQAARKHSRSPEKQRQFLDDRSKDYIKSHLKDLYNGNVEGSESQDKKILGVQGEVTRDSLKAAYRQASAKAHPDRGGSKEAFQRVQRAYENLRQKYNLAKCLISIGGIPYELTESDEGLVLVKALQVGATKEKNGKTYVLNENKRWTLKREEGAAPKKQRSVKPKDAAKPVSEVKPVAPAKEKKPLKPKFSVLEGGGNPEAGEKTFSGGSEVAKLAQKLMSNKPELDAMVARGQETAKKIEAKYGKKPAAKPKLTPIEGGGKSKGKGKAKLTPIEGGKQKPVEQMSLKEMFAEGDRVGSKYQTEPKSLDERREAKAGAQQFMDETGATVASARASGKVRQLKPKTAPTPVETKPTANRPKVTPRKGERKSLRPKAQTPIEHIETSPEIQAAAAQSPKIASAIQQIKKNPGILEKVQAAAINNPGAVEDIAVAAIAMAGQFALMPQADLATAALMQGAIGVATRAGARAGKRIREELKTDPNTLKSLQGAIKLGKGILSDLMSKETQEKMISDAIGPAMAAGTGAAVGGGLAGTVAGTGAAVGAAPKAAGAIRQTIANKLQPKRKALKNG